MPVEGSGYWSWPERAGRVGWLGRAGYSVRPPTSDGHNFFVRTPFWVFLDSMESLLSQDSSHVPVEGRGTRASQKGQVDQGRLGRLAG